MRKYEIFIGLEIHIHLKTESKMFCRCKARYGDEPNTNVCPICLGYPGTLPQMNKQALEMGYLVAMALGCRTSKKTSFARKNYFYPDMPKNYQISQFEEPIGVGGIMPVIFEETREKNIRIHDVHLEEDAGKMIHSRGMSQLDFNRAGYPLLEIVTEPDLKSGEETEAFLRSFQRLVRYLGVCDGNMDEGSMKCDANISINIPGKGLGTKVELKNMNSPRFVRLALAYESQRQEEVLEAGGTIIQETRLWNENRSKTESMRRKETADDYRYFPEPDMPPFTPDTAFMNRVKNGLVELPSVLKKRLITEYQLTPEQAEFIHDDIATVRLFEDTVARGSSPAKIAAWLSSDVQKLLNRENLTIAESPLNAHRFHELLSLVEDAAISGKIAKKVLDKVFSENKDPATIVKDEAWVQIVDAEQIGGFVDKIIKDNPQVVQAIREGSAKQKGWLMGQIMKLSGGKASPEIASQILNERLQSL